MSLLSICTAALGEIGGLGVPMTIVGNADPTATQALALSNKVGQALAREYDWENLKIDYTFNTVANQPGYMFPADFKRMVPLTIWDRTDRWPLLGPATDVEWQTLLGRLNPGGSRFWYREAGNQLLLFPTPTAVIQIAYTYISKSWCQSASGTNQMAWIADTDVGRLDEDLLTRGLIYEIKAAKGLPSQAALDDYNDALTRLKGDDSPRGMVDFGSTDSYRRSRWPLLPDGNFGSF